MSPQLASLVALIRRYPYCAICFFVAVACGGSSWYLWGSVKDLQVVLEDRSKEGKGMLDTLVGGSTQRSELAAVREVTRRIDDNLVGEALAENYWYFFKIQEQAKAQLPDLHELNSPINGNTPLFRRVPYTLRATGTYEQVASFLLAIESGPRLAKITSFGFTRNNASVTLDLSLEMLGKK